MEVSLCVQSRYLLSMFHRVRHHVHTYVHSMYVYTCVSKNTVVRGCWMSKVTGRVVSLYGM